MKNDYRRARSRSDKPTGTKIRNLAKIIETWSARGFGTPAGLSSARAALDTAQQALEAKDPSKAAKGLATAMGYLSVISKQALNQLARERKNK